MTVSQIIKTYGGDARVDLGAILPRWIAQLPVLVDGEEFEPVCSLLNNLVLQFVILPSDPGFLLLAFCSRADQSRLLILQQESSFS